MANEKLKDRAKLLQIEDPQWYFDAYLRATDRLRDEAKRPKGLNAERLARRLQHLYDKCVGIIEDDKLYQQKARATEIAINHAVTDHGFPRSLCKDYDGNDKEAS